ncbi:MAG: hypothetical protein DME90_12220 [Verrucomicrobia bacterium]|nr:MAG: hypothetical protein DME90_12220 [Verrucomicrobiota bacterium]
MEGYGREVHTAMLPKNPGFNFVNNNRKYLSTTVLFWTTGGGPVGRFEIADQASRTLPWPARRSLGYRRRQPLTIQRFNHSTP